VISDRGGALVTGGAKRVGRALCLALAKAGYAVAVHHRGDEAEANALVETIRAEGGSATAIYADLAEADQASTLASDAAAAVGALTLLVNNASHFGDDSIETLTPKSWADHIGPNLFGPILLTQAFAKGASLLPQEADPSVINLIDQRVLRPNPQFFSYTISKSALYTATQTLAQALAPRIRVNGIGPGPTLPSIHQSQATFDAEAANIPLQRKTELCDITEAALFLTRARSVTGQMIAVDGGQHLSWKTPDIVEG